MADKLTPGKAEIEIPYALLDYTALFKKSVVGKLGVPAIAIGSILDALEPSGFTSDGIEIKTRSEKLSEYAIVFRRARPEIPAISFTLGLNKVSVSIENPDWASAESLIVTMEAGLQAAFGITGAETRSQQISLGMHIQIKSKPRKDVTASLLSPTAYELMDGEVEIPGIILLRNKASIIIDGSLAYANGLFIRIIREHPPETSLENLAAMLRRDEEHVFEVLGLEGTL
jgi:hypothetical protein